MAVYAGYRVLPEGLAVWPRHRLRYRWNDLSVIATMRRPDGRGWLATLVFSVGGELKLGGAKVFSWGSAPGRFAEVLATACERAPATAEIDETTRELARWGTRAVRRQTRSAEMPRPDEAGLLARARNQRAWLEPRRALRTVESLLSGNAHCGEAHRLRLTLLEEQGRRPPELLAAADRWFTACPDDAAAREARALAGLRANVLSIESEVAAWLEHSPDQLRLTAAWCDHHFRQGDAAAALRGWERFAAATADDGARRMAERNVDYLRRYIAQPGFRRREQVRRAGRIAAAWLPVTLLVALYAWRAWLAWHPPAPPPPDPVVQRTVDAAREEVVKADRWLLENTGLLSGSDAAIRTRAEQGDAAAQYTRASHLLGQAKDPGSKQEGLRLLEAAAAQHYRWAMLDLGERLDAGDDGVKDPSRALLLFEGAAGLGSPRGACRAGEHYLEGSGVAKDEVRALQLFEQSAAGGNPEGMTWAGSMFEHGTGVTADRSRAIAYYRKAAALQNPRALDRLVDLRLRDTDYAAAVKELTGYARPLAEQGSGKYRMLIAGLLLNEPGADPELRAQALAWLESAAKEHNAFAAYLRGMFPCTGSGEKFDPVVAAHWFDQAAEQGLPVAIETLCHCYAFGIGVKRDPARARALRQQLAAMPNTAKACAELDRMLAVADAPLPDPSAWGASPTPLYQARPTHPYGLRREEVEGKAIIGFHVQPDGFVTQVEVVRATESRFGAAAALAVSAWRFVPAKGAAESGKAFQMQVPILFSLDGERPSSPGDAPHEGPAPAR